MDYKIVLVAFVMISHVQSKRNYHQFKQLGTIERILRDLNGNKEERSEEEADAAAERQETVDVLVGDTEDLLEDWKQLEVRYGEALDEAMKAGAALGDFVEEETEEGTAEATILAKEDNAIHAIFTAATRLVDIQREKRDFFEAGTSLVKKWRGLSRAEEFRVESCADVALSTFKVGYEMQLGFSSWAIIADGFGDTLDGLRAGVYVEWADCVREELEQLEQDETFAGSECEAQEAVDIMAIGQQIYLMSEELEKVRSRFDEAISTWKEELENADGECFATNGIFEIIETLENISEARLENDLQSEKINEEFFKALQKWIAYFHPDDPEDADESKKEIFFGILQNLLDGKAFE